MSIHTGLTALDVFAEADKDDSGTLSLPELKTALTQNNMCLMCS